MYDLILIKPIAVNLFNFRSPVTEAIVVYYRQLIQIRPPVRQQSTLTMALGGNDRLYLLDLVLKTVRPRGRGHGC